MNPQVKAICVFSKSMKRTRIILLLLFLSIILPVSLQANASLLNIGDEIDELNDSIAGINDEISELNSILSGFNKSFSRNFSNVLEKFDLLSLSLMQKFDTLNSNIEGIESIDNNLCKATDAIQDFFVIIIVLFISTVVCLSFVFLLFFNRMIKKIDEKSK